MNRARPMAARLTTKKNKPRVDQEPRSAHGRAVNKLIVVVLKLNDSKHMHHLSFFQSLTGW